MSKTESRLRIAIATNAIAAGPNELGPGRGTGRRRLDGVAQVMGNGPRGPSGGGPTDGDLPPGINLPGHRKALVLAGILSTLFLAALDQTIVSVSLPRIVADLGGLNLFVWPFTAYMLTSTAIVPLVGKVSDVYGRKPLMLFGIAVFLVGSSLSGASASMSQLIAFRALQGLGAGLIMTTAFTAVGDLFAPRERGRWMGLFTGTFGLASIIGPLLGGALTDNLSWRWIFYINVPVGLVAVLLISYGMPWYRRPSQMTIDYVGGALLVATVVPLLLGLSWAGNQYGWGEFPVLASLGSAALFLGLFLAQMRRSKDPVLPLHLFRNRVYTVSILASMVLGIGMFGALQFLPLFSPGCSGRVRHQLRYGHHALDGRDDIRLRYDWTTGQSRKGRTRLDDGRRSSVAGRHALAIDSRCRFFALGDPRLYGAVGPWHGLLDAYFPARSSERPATQPTGRGYCICSVLPAGRWYICGCHVRICPSEQLQVQALRRGASEIQRTDR